MMKPQVELRGLGDVMSQARRTLQEKFFDFHLVTALQNLLKLFHDS